MGRIIYIAGPIKGDPDYRAHFDQAERTLSARGWTVINPAILPQGLHPSAYMPICLKMLDAADAIALLPDWQHSPGAKIERAYAAYQRKAVYKDVGFVPVARDGMAERLNYVEIPGEEETDETD